MCGVYSDYLETTGVLGILLTEEDVRERVNLRRQNLGDHPAFGADIRSLSLPGVYEKITHLGNSLKKFVYLKSLDLSRNALTTLEGLKHLIYLEKLNLYFNHISSLSEVLRLHNLTALQVVDFRLNPVVKNESDYRLFVVHMLPNLRHLDDCPVTECDRKASLLHFTSDQAYTFKKSAVLAKRIKPSRFIHPRVEYINSMSKRYLAVDEDDETALRLLAKCEWDLRKHAETSVSSKKDPEVELHSLKSIYEMKENSKKWKSEFSLPQFFLLQKKSLFQNTLSEDRNTLKGTTTDKELVFNIGWNTLSEDRNTLKGTTTDKGVNESLLISRKMVGPVQKASRLKEQRFNGKDALPQGTTHLMNTNLYEATPMQCLLDLVDKYWNGSKSLHCNETFLAQAEMVLSAVQKSLPAGQQKYSTENQELNKLLLEKEALQQCLSQQEKQYSIRIKNLKSELSKNKKDMDVLKQYLNKLLKEKEGLKVHKFKVEESIQISDIADTSSLQITDFEDDHQLLIDENASMKKNLQNFNKMREMTEMLQESHRTLISTNEHLLKQLNEMHLKHKAEVEQLHCNYNQLKKTMDTLSPKS
ncbi:centrosomal protein of 72 kDa [Ahaetulla prasina]|uniref:centrosomal protein of 72 kDa n=1 Tax=Ahaetulla prasina TaxID=499056 RepID=UPI0026490B7E|nr:centrosomal protein of 72 kDa [Ahaetulla prasina]